MKPGTSVGFPVSPVISKHTGSPSTMWELGIREYDFVHSIVPVQADMGQQTRMA